VIVSVGILLFVHFTDNFAEYSEKFILFPFQTVGSLSQIFTMNISALRSTAYVVPGIDDTEGSKEAYVCMSGEITQHHMASSTHSTRGALASLVTTDTVAFFNLARETVVLHNVPCETRVHEDYVNTDLFTSTVHHGGMLSARGQQRPWKDRFDELIAIVKNIDEGFVNIDLPGQMEYEESFAAVSRELEGIKNELEEKNILILVQGEPVVKYITCTTKSIFDPDHNQCAGIIRHDHRKYTDIITSLSCFAVVYKTTLAEAFAHVAGQCTVESAAPGHFLVRLPSSIVPMRLNGQSVGVSALGTGAIVQDSLTYGSGNGGFLFDASIGKWSVSFFAQVSGVPGDSFDAVLGSGYDFRTRLCIDLLKSDTPSSTGATFFTLISEPPSTDQTFEQLVSTLMRCVEKRYGVFHQGVSRPRYAAPAMCRNASVGMGQIFAKDPLL
tara:strand:- start:988 stop:2310 length:1323 start_codon:yes stop_codon:yes gene_type:complete